MSKVLIYSTQTCPYCVKVKDYLSSHNIEFEDIDLSNDQDRVQEMIDKSGQMGVPVIDIGGEIMVGFDQAQMKEKLGL